MGLQQRPGRIIWHMQNLGGQSRDSGAPATVPWTAVQDLRSPTPLGVACLAAESAAPKLACFCLSALAAVVHVVAQSCFVGSAGLARKAWASSGKAFSASASIVCLQ